MKKSQKLILTGLAIIILGITGYLILNYHTTAEGAIDELRAETKTPTLQWDETKAFIIEEDGRISIAYSKVTRLPSRIYKDFEISPTKLNINDIEGEKDILYSNFPKEYSAFGLIKSDQVEYSIRSNPNQLDNAMKVFHLDEYFDDTKFRDVKLWYIPFTLSPENIEEVLNFLDKNNKVLEVDKEQSYLK